MNSGKIKGSDVWIHLLCIVAVIQVTATVDDASHAAGDLLANEDRHTVKGAVHTTGTEAASASEDTEMLNNKQTANSDVKSNTMHHALQLYRRLFRQKRSSHIDAVKKIIGLNSYEKQTKMLQAIFSKLFMVLKEARVRLMEASYTPGDSIPSEEGTLDGDLALRLPDITHSLLDLNSDWKSLSSWAVVFCNDTRVLIDKDAEHLNLMAQELGIIEKHPSFINPFKAETLVSQTVDSELQQILAEQKRKQQKKEKREQKKKQKGPRMSSQRHTEL